jgi:hypothetical protein
MPGLQQLFGQSLQLRGIGCGVNRPGEAFHLKLLANCESCVLDITAKVNNTSTLSTGICFSVAKTTLESDVSKSRAGSNMPIRSTNGSDQLLLLMSSRLCDRALVRQEACVHPAWGWLGADVGYFCPSRHSSLLVAPGSTARRRQIRLKVSWAESSPSSCHFKLAGWRDRRESGTNRKPSHHKLWRESSLCGSTHTTVTGRFPKNVTRATSRARLRPVR